MAYGLRLTAVHSPSSSRPAKKLGLWNSVTWAAFSDPLATVSKVVLMRPGAVTHHTDMDQRYILLESQVDTSNDPPIRRFFVTPKSAAHAPRGWYMLFLVTNDGVPSVASWVHLQ